jgi:hypothetical protein
VQLLVQFRALAGNMLETLNVETTILIGKLAGARFDATREHALADARNPQLVMFLHKFLELCRQVANLVAEFFKFGAANPPRENPELPRLSVNLLRHVDCAQTLYRQIAADFIGETERSFGVVRYERSRRFETESS